MSANATERSKRPKGRSGKQSTPALRFSSATTSLAKHLLPPSLILPEHAVPLDERNVDFRCRTIQRTPPDGHNVVNTESMCIQKMNDLRGFRNALQRGESVALDDHDVDRVEDPRHSAQHAKLRALNVYLTECRAFEFRYDSVKAPQLDRITRRPRRIRKP